MSSQPERPVAWYRIPEVAAVPIFAWGDWPPPEPDDTVWHPLYASPDGRPVGEIERLTRELEVERMCHESASKANSDKRAEIERLHRELNAARDPMALGNLTRRCDELYASEQRLRAALEKIGTMSCVMGYDSGHAGIDAVVREALGEVATADETTALWHMGGERLNEPHDGRRADCEKCRANVYRA